jgi:hypothetical protein
VNPKLTTKLSNQTSGKHHGHSLFIDPIVGGLGVFYPGGALVGHSSGAI